MKPRGAFLFALGLLALPALALACPTCKDALGESAEGLGFARGIYLSIILMLGTLFSAVGFFIYKIVKAARQETGRGDAPSA
jgi:hypothetical protein